MGNKRWIRLPRRLLKALAAIMRSKGDGPDNRVQVQILPSANFADVAESGRRAKATNSALFIQ